MPTQEADIQKVKRDRKSVSDRLATRFPERNFDADDDFYGQIYDDYDEMDRLKSSNDKYLENSKKLTDLFNSDPESADFLLNWRDNGGGILGNLVRTYGVDRLREALDDPEKMEELSKQNKEYLEKVAEDKKLDDEYSQNLPKALAAADEAINSGTLSEEDFNKAVTSLQDKMIRFIKGNWTMDDIQSELKSLNHDTDVATASEQGEIRGRNANIQEKTKRRSQGDGTANLGGGGTGQTRTRQAPDLGALDRFDSRNIYERGGEKRRKYN